MKKFALISLPLLLLLPMVSAIIGPKAYVTESVLSDYHANGSLDASETFPPCSLNPCKFGVVEVAVPNSVDVLQQVRVNLSSTSNTDLDSNTTYANSLTSYPTAWRRQNVSVNTTTTAPSEWYNVTNGDVAPSMKLSMTIQNYAGGNDLFDDDNVETPTNALNFTLNVSNPGTVNLNGSNVSVQFEIDVVGGADVINLSNPNCGSGICWRVDTDSDGYYDKIEWSVNLTSNDYKIIYFDGNTTDGVNFDANSVNLDSTNDKGGRVDYGNLTTLTGIYLTDKFCKGPVEQGIDMAQNSTSEVWLVRGFIVNEANSTLSASESITYNVTGWRLYEINASTGEPLSDYIQNGNFSPGTLSAGERLYTTSPSSSNTSWYDTGSTSKPFFGSYFTWEVIWNSSNPFNHRGYVNSTMDLPILYKIDMINDKSLSGYILPNTGGDEVTITDTTRHYGHDDVPGKFIRIISVVPVNTTNGEFHGWFDVNETSIEFYFDNTTLGGDSYELSTGDYANWTAIDPTNDGSADGYVNLTITDLSQVSFSAGGTVGHYLRPNEKIKLIFDVISNESMTGGDVYNFTGNSTQKTESGTPLTEFQPSQTIEVSWVSISLPIDVVDFGNMTLNEVNDTLDDAPYPFILENDGSVDVNVTINGTDLWLGTGAQNPSSYYQFESTENETGSVPSPEDLVSWTYMNLNSIKFVTRLNYTVTNNSVRGEINVTVPSDEPPGVKNSTVTFVGSQA